MGRQNFSLPSGKQIRHSDEGAKMFYDHVMSQQESTEKHAVRAFQKSLPGDTSKSRGWGAIETQLVPRNCSHANEVFKLIAEDRMEIHCSTIVSVVTQGSGALVFISYSILNSIIPDRFVNEENLPVNFTPYHIQEKEEDKEAICVYWKQGTWSWEDCTMLRTNSNYTAAATISSFAVLMAPTDREDCHTLNILTYVRLSISLLCLLPAILTFLLCHTLWNVSTAIHLQLCLCLFLGDLLFLTSVTHNSNQLPGERSIGSGSKDSKHPGQKLNQPLPPCPLAPPRPSWSD
ncbi:hypothetical protein Y1Q_0000126 [Alligator mississippiensis]|uniref:Uncharacterized protein n=1 Tax=Alligator mississippiensis TaxID=8496 RepID=A0A151M323_ALLMI|nr:hypothetical protein Y1Q_0000126 [Alligator mississippiensis]